MPATMPRKKDRSHFEGLNSLKAAPPPEDTIRQIPERPRSKRADPAYRMWSGLLRKQVVTDAVVRLKQTNDTRDMSDLVGDLIAAWLETPRVQQP